MAERDFTAERGNLSFVSEEAAGALLASSGASSTRLMDTVSGTVRSLAIPRRPRWRDFSSSEELHRAEKDAFLAWRRDVAIAELAHGGGLASPEVGHMEAAVTPFEKNLQVWRQLWRVVERCDVLVQIGDARNPLLFRCEDLE
jgi:large subunit GTPase 1